MKNDQLLDQILPILHSVKDDDEKLQQILDFLLEEIYEEPEDEFVIPEKYRKVVHDIAESLDCGHVCFLNPKTLEMEDVPKMLVYDSSEYRLMTGMSKKDLNLSYPKWKKCITIDPPESSESFAFMEDFVSEVDDKDLKSRLTNALRNRSPFANFKNQIDNSKYREQWFAFKQQKLEEYVWQNLEYEVLPKE